MNLHYVACCAAFAALSWSPASQTADAWLGTWLDQPVAAVAAGCQSRVATLDALPSPTRGERRERKFLQRADDDFARYAPTEDPFLLRADVEPVAAGLKDLFKSNTAETAVLDGVGPVLDGLFGIADEWAATAADVGGSIEHKKRRKSVTRKLDAARSKLEQARRQRTSRPDRALAKLMAAIKGLWKADLKARKAVEKEIGYWDYPGIPCAPSASQVNATFTMSNGPLIGPQAFTATNAETIVNTRLILVQRTVSQVYLTARTAPTGGLEIGLYFQGSVDHPDFPGAGTHSLVYADSGWMAQFVDDATGAWWIATGGSITVTDVDLAAGTWSGSFQFVASPSPYADPPTAAQGTVTVTGGTFQVSCLEVY